MSSVKVGVRELKTKLSAYVREVEAGATVIITERGRPVGRISAIQPSRDHQIRELEQSGLFRWSGKKFAPAKSPIKTRVCKTIAAVVLEGRR